MPHIAVKLYPGRTEEQKKKLTEEIVNSVTSICKCDDKAVSVSFEEIAPDDWKEKVYLPEIMSREELLTKKPGYTL